MTICQHADISSSQFVEAWLFTRNMTLYFSITGSGWLKKASGWETIGTGYFMYMIYVTMTPWRTVIQGLTELRPPTIWGQDFHALRCPTKIGFASTFRSPIIYKLLHIKLLHINTIITLHPWNQRSPSNRCDLKLSAAYMLLQHVDRDTDVSPIHFLSWISMLKQFCVPTRRCKLTTGWPFWCHGDSHGKASHGRMDSSRVHYAMWGDHKNTKRLQVVFESLTCLLNLLNCFWFLVPISGCSAGPYPLHRDGWVGLLDHRRGRAAFVSDVFRISKSVAEVGSVGRIQDLLGRGIGQWVHEGSLIAFQLDLFQYEAGVELNMDTVYWTWITWAHCSEYTVCIAKTIDLNIRSYYFCIIFIFIFTYLFDDTLIHPESIQISSRSEATSKKHVQHSA